MFVTQGSSIHLSLYLLKLLELFALYFRPKRRMVRAHKIIRVLKSRTEGFNYSIRIHKVSWIVFENLDLTINLVINSRQLVFPFTFQIL